MYIKIFTNWKKFSHKSRKSRNISSDIDFRVNAVRVKLNHKTS